MEICAPYRMLEATAVLYEWASSRLLCGGSDYCLVINSSAVYFRCGASCLRPSLVRHVVESSVLRECSSPLQSSHAVLLQEDRLLKDLVSKHGAMKWAHIAKVCIGDISVNECKFACIRRFVDHSSSRRRGRFCCRGILSSEVNASHSMHCASTLSPDRSNILALFDTPR